MPRKGRRLKRYFGLKRSSSSGLLGGLETITPGCLSGWVALPDEPLFEVRLLVGPHLIARAPIDQERSDVSTKFGLSGKLGFSLVLPFELPPLDWNKVTPILSAMSVDGSVQAEIKLISNPQITSELLIALLQSELLGLEGHCDGLLHDGLVHGWAARRGQKQPVTIWIQCDGNEPCPLICNQDRGGLDGITFTRAVGFSQSLESLPDDWAGKEIWFSFDEMGAWPLPQLSKILVPARTNRSELTHLMDSSQKGIDYSHYQHEISSSPPELKEHWRTLDEFCLFLDTLEQEIAQFEKIQITAQKPDHPSSPNFKGIIRFFRRGI